MVRKSEQGMESRERGGCVPTHKTFEFEKQLPRKKEEEEKGENGTESVFAS